MTTTNTSAVTSAVLTNIKSPEESSCILFGSFQGNAGSSPTAGHIRGAWVSAVTRVSAGRYRVQVNLNLPNALVAGQDAGLLAEAKAWVCSDNAGSTASAPAKYTATQTSSYDTTTNINTFDIWVYDIVGAALYDVTSADRVNFELAWKNTASLP